MIRWSRRNSEGYRLGSMGGGVIYRARYQRRGPHLNGLWHLEVWPDGGPWTPLSSWFRFEELTKAADDHRAKESIGLVLIVPTT